MQFKLDGNAKEVAKRVGKKGKELSASVKKALSITAQQGINIIEARASKGIGFKGAFKPYSTGYALFRSESGRGTKPDLSFTGKMLGSITSRATGKKAVIFFTRASEAKKAAYNNKSRPFFGFNRTEQKQLGKIFFRALK